MATVDVANRLPEVDFDASKLSITTTPPQPRRSLKTVKSHAKAKDIVSESDKSSRSTHHHVSDDFVSETRGQSQRHGISDRLANGELLTPDPKEHSAANSEPSTPITPLSAKSDVSPGGSRKSKKDKSLGEDIEAAKTRARAEREAKKAAKVAREAAKVNKQSPQQQAKSKDDASITQNDMAEKAPSKHKLLAPPPICSSRNNRERASSATRSPLMSPTPSPSPPPSPYLSPGHPNRKDGIIAPFNHMFDTDTIKQLSPETLAQHPHAVQLGLFGATLLVAMLALRVPFAAPFSAMFMLVRFLWRHKTLAILILSSIAAILAYQNRRAVKKFYRSLFLPPFTDSLPDVLGWEDVQLSSFPREKIAKWAKEIDANTEVTQQSSSQSQSSPMASPASAQSPTAKGGKDSDLPVMFDQMSGTTALVLMESYQHGDLDDCEFHCLRVFDKRHNESNGSDDTVGFIFVSIKRHYDVSPSLLRIFTPIQACFPWLCMPALLSTTIRKFLTFRFAVIGFHWPFRSCIVFTKSTQQFKQMMALDDGKLQLLYETIGFDNNDNESDNEFNEATAVHVAREAAMLALAKKWDQSQPKGQRSDFLLFTCSTASQITEAIALGGGARIPILPTYVADIRMVKGQDWQAYKRYLRHQNRKVREAPFENAGGHIELTKGPELEDSTASHLCRLWKQVAGFRGSRDATNCLMEPNQTFVQQLTHHPSGVVDFLALQLHDTVVAASLLFSLSSSVLTSDVAGFDYEALEEAGRKANQQIKAYPVKLAAVIKHGIAHQYDFVDFGPTTGPSKMELGCKEVKLTGGLFYHGVVTSIVVKLAALCLSSQHTVARE